MMKKKPLLLFAGFAVIAACVFAWVVVLPTSRVTKANFDRIKVGMTPAEAVEILGEKTAWPRHGEWSSYYFFWSASDGSCALVGFRDGHVVELHWFDSTETFWEKLQGWVGL